MSESSVLSKTQRKREMLALQGLGEELTGLKAQQLAALELPERLHEAVREAQRLSQNFGAHRRQLRYIGRLMREVDAQPLREKLAALRGSSRAHTAWLHRIERWRKRLLTEDEALSEFALVCPDTDFQRLRLLIRNARSEALENRPPRSFRALFQELRKVFPEGKLTDPPPPEE
jgi:ribosome-associated protein